MAKRVIYGESNYATIVRENGHFVDKSGYIPKLETVKNPIFLRPRRFGKSLFCSMLRYYYDLNYADHFAELFGQTWIGQHPTPYHNEYIVLFFNFSEIDLGKHIEKIEHSFKNHGNTILKTLQFEYRNLLADIPNLNDADSVSDNLGKVLGYMRGNQLPQVYVIIDEYDNFANQLITSNQDVLYGELTADGGFLKTFFKTLKAGRENGSIANIFITGVLPVTIDELASAFNIGTFLTLEPGFESMLGFTQAEVDQLLDKIYADYALDPATRSEVNAIIKSNYNGYHFVDPEGDALYNSTILIYFLRYFTVYKEIPEALIDFNLKTDLSWVRRITSGQPGDTEEFVNQLTQENRIPYNRDFLISKFDISQFFEKGFYPISFFYLGLLTKADRFYLRLPNLNLRQIFVQYFNQLHHIDVSTRYAEMMQSFVNQPDLERLFAGYWQEYIGQFPEAVFQRVNENFYRATFFELCSTYLSPWFTWNMERSYPEGKSDLEFVGKYHEKFAGMRLVLEFKYISNRRLQREQIKIDEFKLPTNDTEQIRGYARGLHKEYPEAQIALFVIYCFGNQGYRIFPVDNNNKSAA
ncbi:MAG: AAA family ATPase [Caldilineaceae bacterium]